jgi:alpha-L-arabinofuranosidase
MRAGRVKSAVIILVLVAAAGVVLIGLGLQARSPSSSIANPGFEQGEESPPAGWFLDPEAARKGEVTVVDSPVAEGERALRLAPNEHNTGGQTPLGVGQILTAEGLYGRTLSISAALAGHNGAAAVVGLAVVDKSGAVLADTSLRSDAAPPLEPHSARLGPIPDEAQSLIVFLVAEGRSGEAYFDDVALRVEEAEPERETEGAVFEAVVSVSSDREITPVRRHLFGTNVEWIRNAQGLWDPETGSLDDEVVELARRAGVTLVRFPGGVWSDAYDWRDGVGPQAERPRRPHYPGDEERSPNVVGTDEILEFARRIDADLLLTLNLGHGTPEMAAEWVGYMRDAIGDAERPRVLWQLGNELYMEDDLSGGHTSPEGYIERAAAVIEAAREVDPTAVIYAIGLENYGRYQFNSYDDWNERVLDGLGDSIDGLTVHNAYAPLLLGERGGSPESVYRAMLAAPVNIAANMKTTAGQLQAVNPSLSLGVTEWGPFFAIDPQNPYFDHVKTLGSAVFVARTLNVFLRSPKVEMANFFKLSDLLNMGWIGRKPGGGYGATPALEVHRLYATYLDGVLLETDVAGPSFDGGPVGFTDRVEAAPMIDAVASRSADGQIAVLVSNASLYDTASIELSLVGHYSAEIEVLSGPSPDSHAGTGMITVPGLTFADSARFSSPRPSSLDEIAITTRKIQAGKPLQLELPATSVAAVRLHPEE